MRRNRKGLRSPRRSRGLPGFSLPSLPVVVALAFVAGGAARLVPHYADCGATEVRAVAEKSADVSREAVPEAEVAGIEDGESPEAGGSYALAAVDVNDEAENLSVETEDRAEDVIAVPAEKSRRSAGGVRRGAQMNSRAGSGPVAARRYARGSGDVARGGRSVAAQTVGGLKKTGKVIGSAFGKVGGLFHD